MTNFKIWFVLIAIVELALPNEVLAQQVSVGGLSDVSFGSVSYTASDLTNNQNVCVYASNLLAPSYQIYVLGSGNASELTLSSGSKKIPYEVQWSSAPSQTSGTNMDPNDQKSFSISIAKNCLLPSFKQSTLTIIIRASSINSADGGTYSGTLTLIVQPN
jgi:hypothetical protein